MLPLKQSVADWITVRIEGADGVGVTGIAYNDAGLSAKLAKAGAVASAKALASGEWVEQANGYYWVRLTAGNVDTVGPGTLIVIYSGTEIAVPFRVECGNSVIDSQVYSGGKLTSARIRYYDSKTNADAAGATGLISTDLVTASYTGENLTLYKLTRDA